MKLQKLTYLDKDGKINAPLGPGEAAKEMVRQGLIAGITDIYRLYNGSDLHQVQEGPKDWEKTGYDTLIITCKHKSFTVYFMIIDQGTNLKPVSRWLSNEEKPLITSIYENSEYLEKLSENKIMEAFKMAV